MDWEKEISTKKSTVFSFTDDLRTYFEQVRSKWPCNRVTDENLCTFESGKIKKTVLLQNGFQSVERQSYTNTHSTTQRNYNRIELNLGYSEPAGRATDLNYCVDQAVHRCIEQVYTN